MMASSRPRGDFGNAFASRRGHANQLSISDPSHHVTEAIGTLYGDDEEPGQDASRPLSFMVGSNYQDQIHRTGPQQDQVPNDGRRHLMRAASEQAPASSPLSAENGSFRKAQTLPVRTPSLRNSSTEGSPHSPMSPTPSLREVQADNANSQYALTNIDNPRDIAQELSNLQALRRLSMDVGNSIDPDLPPMSLSAMPAVAPTGDDDENDPSRLLWVPARVHPELAPTEFKSFLEKRVQSIRRRSGDSLNSNDGDAAGSDSGSLSPTSLSSGSLSRKRSMLSRQIDNSGGRGAVGYVDGAERLERQRSRGQHNREVSIDELVSDPSKVVQKLTEESQPSGTGSEGSEDMPILPVGPGMGLRRSTRTTYRKGGSLRHGDRTALSRRAAQRSQEGDLAEKLPSPKSPDAPPGHGLSRVQSEPIGDNFSRPGRSVRRQGKFAQESPAALERTEETDESGANSTPQPYQDQLPSRSSSAANRSQEALVSDRGSYEDAGRQESQFSRTYLTRKPSEHSSQPPPQDESQQEAAIEEPPARSSRRPAGVPLANQTQSQQPQYMSTTVSPQQMHTVNETLAANPSALPGSGSTRTDALTFIPTLSQEERKGEKKSKKDRDDDSSSTFSTRSGAWKWFKSSDDKDKKKDEGKKSKTKALVEKAQDNVRLDVIQSSIDKNAPKGRESLVLDRDNVDSKLQEERKKENNRKSDAKREKDGNIFSSIFGGSKKKEEKDKAQKRTTQHLSVPEEPAYKPLQPDVDFHWTRFPLLEERAIYRMAHIKLANPRRPLHSQVLLSNFMYSYLAIVQAMHPQMNVPTSPQQKRLEEEARRKQQEEEYMAQQMQDDDGSNDLDQYNFDYHRAAIQYADSGSHGQVDYVDEAQIYEDEHGNEHRQQDDEYGYDASEGYGQGVKEYYQYHDSGNDHRHGGQGDMW